MGEGEGQSDVEDNFEIYQFAGIVDKRDCYSQNGFTADAAGEVYLSIIATVLLNTISTYGSHHSSYK